MAQHKQTSTLTHKFKSSNNFLSLIENLIHSHSIATEISNTTWKYIT